MRGQIVCAFFAVLGALLYLNTLDGELIFDDRVAIVENRDLRPRSPWSNLLLHDYWGEDVRSPLSHKSYRPLTGATFKLNYHLHQLTPRGYHVGNVLLHGAVCYLFAAFCMEAFGSPWPAVIAALLFTVHPIHTDAVASVVGRAEILCSVFYLSSLLAYRKSLHSKQSHLWLLLSVLFCLCSFLSKEHGITVLPVCLSYHVFIELKMDWSSAVSLLQIALHFRRERMSKSSRRLIRRAVIFGVIAVATLATRLWFMRGGPSFGRTDNPAQTLFFPYKQLYLLHLVVVNLWLLMNPSHLLQDWRLGAAPLVESIADPRNFLTLATFVAILAVCVRGLKGNGMQRRIVMFALTLSGFSFLPASNLLFLVGFVVAERVLYIPSMGYCILVGHAVWHLMRTSNKWFRMLVKLGCVFLMAVQAAKTLVRNADWQDGLTMYRASIRTYPGNGMVYSNLGMLYQQMGNDSEAEALHRIAVEMVPQYAQTHRNYGVLLQQMGKYQEAEETYRKALQVMRPVHSRRSRTVETYYALATVIVAQNISRLKEAEDILEQGVSLNPNLAEPHFAKGKFLLSVNKSARAIEAFKKCIHLNPTLKDAYHHLGLAYVQAGDAAKAEESFRKVFSLDPANAGAALELGVLLSESQDVEKITEAKKYLQAILRVDPNISRAWYHLGLAHLKLQNLPKAEAFFLHLLNVEPTNENALLHLGAIYHAQGNCANAVVYLKKLEDEHPSNTEGKALLSECYKQLHRDFSKELK